MVIVLVSVAEFGISKILSRTLIPYLLGRYFDGADVESVSALGIAAIILGIIGTLILAFFKFILPENVGLPIGTIANNLFGGANTRGNGSNMAEMILQEMGARDRAGLLWTVLVISVVLIIPYAVGAFFYARMVVREVKKIEEAELTTEKKYEQRRNMMLSDIAHDLRTPMTTVSGYSKALADGMVPEAKKPEYLDAIQRKSKRVNDLITLLFDYVKLDTEGYKLAKQDTDIAELVREAGAFVYKDVEDAGMTLDVDIPEEVIMVPLDRLQMSRVITNLLTNAVKHNKKGTDIGLYLYREDDYVRILVADNGDRIDKENAEHIFEPFVMGDESRSSKGGTGLGLSIAKKVVEMHGFDIKLVQGNRLEKYMIPGGYEKAFLIGLKL
ncbi:His Kinase A (phospho-acceptor) domain-containing protein [Lachnospiraceae bacterium NE2001]|nr:His Kinase A (phospho-acceptor) domain-containing protein [Lachnospiraceae bacterium NE2001]